MPVQMQTEDSRPDQVRVRAAEVHRHVCSLTCSRIYNSVRVCVFAFSFCPEARGDARSEDGDRGEAECRL